MNFWNVLGIAATDDAKEIKRAYARLLKVNKPDADPEAYQQLRKAYDAAIKYAKSIAQNNEKNTEVQSHEGNVEVEIVSHQHEAQEYSVQEQPSQETSKTSNIQKKEKAQENSESAIEGLSEPVLEGHKTKSVKLVNGIVNVLCTKGTVKACYEFDKTMDSDDLWDIDLRSAVEGLLFYYLYEYSDQFYPWKFAQHVLEFYGWHNSSDTDVTFNGNLDYILSRISAGRKFDELHALANQKSHITEEFRRIKAAQYLLGPIQKYKFIQAIFFANVFMYIKNILNDCAKESHLIFNYEMNTQTVEWWYRRRNKVYYNISYFLLSALMAVPVFFGFVKQVNDIVWKDSVAPVWFAIILFALVLSGVSFLVLGSTWLYIKFKKWFIPKADLFVKYLKSSSLIMHGIDIIISLMFLYVYFNNPKTMVLAIIIAILIYTILDKSVMVLMAFMVLSSTLGSLILANKMLWVTDDVFIIALVSVALFHKLVFLAVWKIDDAIKLKGSFTHFIIIMLLSVALGLVSKSLLQVINYGVAL